MTLQLIEAAFARGLGDVDLAADRLRHERDQVRRQVDALLDGGWSGSAAVAFAARWEDWLTGADDVLDGLAAMGQLLRAAAAGLHGGDQDSAALLQQVSARILDRLGP